MPGFLRRPPKTPLIPAKAGIQGGLFRSRRIAQRPSSARAASGRRAVARWRVRSGKAGPGFLWSPPKPPLIPAKAGIQGRTRGLSPNVLKRQTRAAAPRPQLSDDA